MRWVKRILIVFVSVPVLLIGLLLIYDRFESARTEHFYATHPMLRAMRDSPRSSSDPWAQMTELLLARVVPGTSRQDAMQVLSSEGIQCSPSGGPLGSTLVVCGPRTKPTFVPTWYIEVMFNRDDRVSGGRVMVFKA